MIPQRCNVCGMALDKELFAGPQDLCFACWLRRHGRQGELLSRAFQRYAKEAERQGSAQRQNLIEIYSALEDFLEDAEAVADYREVLRISEGSEAAEAAIAELKAVRSHMKELLNREAVIRNISHYHEGVAEL